ncbi:MAG: NAD(P)H-dependent flavin oxidoreductase [Alphaproteobacteria bacterium]
MTARNELMRRLDMAQPVIQAPMAGGGDTPDLVAAVANAGGLGSVGAAYLGPAQIAEAAQAVRTRTDRPFAINLFTPPDTPVPPFDATPMLSRLKPYHEELGIALPPVPTAPPRPDLSEQIGACLDCGAAVLSFTFGILPSDAIARAQQRGILTVGTATTVAEAVALERAGVDAVVAQGAEAGGHRGTFLGDFEASLIGTMTLVPQIVDAVRIPVIASGGIMDGRGIAAALALGASAVQMGTAFLACAESGAPSAYKAAMRTAAASDTAVTRAFSGRHARGLRNRAMTEIDAAPGEILPFPYQNAMTRAMRTAAAQRGRTEYLSLWAGQGAGLARDIAATELMRNLASETEDAIARLSRS